MKLFIFLATTITALPNVHFFIRSAHPHVHFHQERVKTSFGDIQRQIDEFGLSNRVQYDHLTTDQKSFYQDTLIINALPNVQKRTKAEWVCFLEETTRLVLDRLIEHLDAEQATEPKLLGRGLFDQTAAIIHHFYGVSEGTDYKTFAYPDFDAGFCLNQPLLNRLIELLPEWKESPNFQIDIKHEVMKFINDKIGLKMTSSKHFCGGNWHREQKKCFTQSGKEMADCGLTPNTDILVGVKTAEKFHKDRLKIVRKTWGPKLENVIYYSSIADRSLDTVKSPQTERGHCAKLYFILDDFLEKKENYKWLFIADDDTIFSAYRLHRITACYDANEPVAIGERYGYGLNTGRGYPYLTGGGGMLLSRAAVEVWRREGCQCPQDDAPDDMQLGLCMTRHNVPIVHLPNFHQAKWDEYSEGYLDNNTPLSFHKHYGIDPIQVYANWFGLDDQKWWSTQAHDHPGNERDEL